MHDHSNYPSIPVIIGCRHDHDSRDQSFRCSDSNRQAWVASQLVLEDDYRVIDSPGLLLTRLPFSKHEVNNHGDVTINMRHDRMSTEHLTQTVFELCVLT